MLRAGKRVAVPGQCPASPPALAPKVLVLTSDHMMANLLEVIDNLLTIHLDSGYRWRDHETHLDTLAPGAYVVLGDRAICKHEATRAEILAAWATVSDLPGFALRRSASGRSPALEWHADGPDRGMAIAELTWDEDRSQRAAFGLERQGGQTWLVSWSALIEGDPLALERQRLAALAEIACLDAVRPLGAARTLLDLSYLRLHALPRTPLLFLPETRFTCHGSGVCCTHPMTIGIEANTARFIADLDWQALDPALAGSLLEPVPEASRNNLPFGHMLARDEAGRCRFLTRDIRCSVHDQAGRPIFKPSQIFPYLFSWCPDGICVTVHHMCPSARLGRGVAPAETETDIRGRLALASLLRTDRFRLLSNLEIGWKAFRAIEARLLDLLEGDLPLRRKLWVALSWLEARIEDPDPAVDEAWYQQDLAVLAADPAAAFEEFVSFFDPFFTRLDRRGSGTILLEDYEPILTRWFRSLLFSKATTYAEGLVGGMNDVVVVYRILERQFRRLAAPGVSEHFWREFFGLVTTTNGNFRKFLAACHVQPGTVLHGMGDNPRLGLNLLLRPEALPPATAMMD